MNRSRAKIVAHERRAALAGAIVASTDWREQLVEPNAPTENPASGRLQRRKATTRAAILAAASALFDRQGYDETSIVQVAEQADTGVGTVYGYFRSKEDLLGEVLKERSALATQEYLPQLAAFPDPVERMLAALRRFTTFIQDNRAILHAVFQVSTRPGAEAQPPGEQIFRILEEMLASGVQSGELRAVPVDTTARAIVGLHLMAILRIGIFRDRVDDSALIADLQAIARVLLEK